MLKSEVVREFNVRVKLRASFSSSSSSSGKGIYTGEAYGWSDEVYSLPNIIGQPKAPKPGMGLSK